jgi:MFS family permease
VSGKHAPTWVFGITYIPFGIVGGFVGTTMPWMLRNAGIAVEDIGWFGLATFIPPILQFLYAPIVDLGPRRRTWLIIVSVLGAACLAGAMLVPLPSGAGLFLALVVAAQMISGLIGSCNGGLLAATLPDEKRGEAGGWMNAGNLGGGALGSWVALEMIDWKVAPLIQGLVLANMMIIPSLAALVIAEKVRERRDARELFGTMIRDVWRVASSKPGWTGILFCLSPVGTAALINYFSGLAVDYHASPGMVKFVNGWANGLLTAGGALIGGYLCDRMNRRGAYLLSGGLTALCGLAMMVAPLEPKTYAVGVCAYLFVSGFCYAAFSAMVLEAIGQAGTAASTQYTLFTSAGNAAIAYTGWLDTRFHKKWGPAGLLGMDAALNIGGILVLFLMISFVYGWKRRPTPPVQAS